MEISLCSHTFAAKSINVKWIFSKTCSEHLNMELFVKIVNSSILDPSRHRTLFQHLTDVYTILATSYRHWNHVVCLLFDWVMNVPLKGIPSYKSLLTRKLTNILIMLCTADYPDRAVVYKFLTKSRYYTCISMNAILIFSKSGKVTIIKDVRELGCNIVIFLVIT